MVTSSASSNIEVVGPDGTVESVLSLLGDAAELSPEEQDALLVATSERLRQEYDRVGLPSDVIESVLDRFDVADIYPLYTDIFLGPERTVWLLRPKRIAETLAEGQPIGLGDDVDHDFGVRGTMWEVYGEDGARIGEVGFPKGFEPMRYRDDRVVGSYTDDLGVEKVQVYRVTMSP